MATPVTIVGNGTPVTFVDEAGKTVPLGGLTDRSVALLQSSGAAVTFTGDTAEHIEATIAVPGGALGKNGYVKVIPLWSYTSSASAKTLRVRVGAVGSGIAGVPFLATAPTTSYSDQRHPIIRNANSETVQKGFTAAATDDFFISTINPPGSTAAIDTTQPWEITISGQCASAADSITLEAYLVEVAYHA